LGIEKKNKNEHWRDYSARISSNGGQKELGINYRDTFS